MRSPAETNDRTSRYTAFVAASLLVLLAAGPAWATAVTFAGNTITITGNDAVNDTISVTTDGTYVDITINGDAVTYNDYKLVSQVATVKIYGLGGDDTIDCSGLPIGIRCEVDGGDGVDAITGGPDADTLSGGNGIDTIIGGAGNDVIYGGADNDNLDGGSDNDIISGEDGNDTLIGNTGNDTLNGGAGDDSITGGGGTDTVTYADATSAVTVDLSNAGAQNTVGAGTDTLATIENLTGSAYNDTLTGDGNANTIIGGAGNDTISGGAGADTLNGEAGDDTINGGAGDDTINGGDGVDTLNGDADNDTIYGGAGNDTINGGAGNDILYGEADNDTLIGGDGDDLLVAGSTRHDNTPSALFAIMRDWTVAGRAYAQRVARLTSSAAVLLNRTTVSSDAFADLLTGGAGTDLFLLSFDSGTKDKMTDRLKGESIVDID